MIPRSFQYVAPKTIKEAITLLKKYGDEGKILAGGMSLIPVMKLRLASPSCIIDINGISELEYIRESRGKILIGALTRHNTVETSKLIRQKAYLMTETASWIGDNQVRNMGTIGGSLVHSDPSGDWGATILAMRGEIKVRDAKKERMIKADDFFVDTFTSAIKPKEILTEVRIPILPRSGGAYMKLERKAGDFATVGVAVQLALDADGACKYIGIGLTALGPTNVRSKKAEAVLLGKEISERVIEEAAEAASEDSQPTNDPLRGSAEYKKEMTKVYTKRALMLALSRAKGRE
jgi:carbon-monoxide dehydrogenase medium subunit